MTVRRRVSSVRTSLVPWRSTTRTGLSDTFAETKPYLRAIDRVRDMRTAGGVLARLSCLLTLTRPCSQAISKTVLSHPV